MWHTLNSLQQLLLETFINYQRSELIMWFFIIYRDPQDVEKYKKYSA